ncbi:MAG: TolC family protein [Bacteroidales bacterium]
MYKTILFSLFACCFTTAFSQEDLAAKYRQMAIDYNYDLKSAQRNIEASMELEKMAGADLKPRLSGNANFQFTGNPTELNLNLPMLDQPLSFQGQQTTYGASVSLTQPVYTGGRLLETLRKAQHQQSMSKHQAEVVRSSVCYQTDMQYWTTVARHELVTISDEFRNSMASLVETIRERVEVGMVDPQDLLMAEVKLNEAEYLLLQAQNNFETGRMALNSMIGMELVQPTPVAERVPIVDADPGLWNFENARPEMEVARDQIQIAKSNLKINRSKYLPQVSIGADGSYGKPGYDFRPDMDPNYALYARVSVPIFEWGKRRSEKRFSQQQIGMAEDNLGKVKDRVTLETQTARISLKQALQRVELAASSLSKARDNEQKATERYAEGRISILEVIDAQVYRMNAQMNFTQAKANAQASYAGLMKALNLYGTDGNLVTLYK